MTESTAPEVNTTPDDLTPTPRRGSKLIVFVAAGLLGGAALGAFVVGPRMAAPKSAADSTASAPEAHASEEGGERGAATGPNLLENLVVNPADSRGTRFLLVTIGLQMATPAADADVKARDAQVRDRVLQVLGAKTIDELVDIRGRDQIRHQIAVALDSLFGSGKVRAVFFPQFVVQ